jgi:hypothetical protein
MFKALNRKGVSTAVATTVIILVLVMSLTWMAYTVVLNARQQAQAAERAETIALKAKELIRVYVWLDPAQQTNGQYLNLTRISFVGSWSGETTINGLLVVYRDGSSRMLGLNIRLGAGEEKTYLPSELGIAGLDNYDAFRRAIKYIQAHTSLGNDFVSLWGRPDKPAIYIVTTTNTGTTATTTSTTTPPTTTTTTTTPPTTTTTTSTTTSPPTTTTTTPPPTTTTTTPPPTVTTTVTVTETRYVYTRCTNVDWRYTTVTSWYTSTVYAGAVTTSTQWVTSTAWVTSTTPTTVTVWTTITQTATAWTTVFRWTTFTTTATTYISETRTSWRVVVVTQTFYLTLTYWGKWWDPGRFAEEEGTPCSIYTVVTAVYNNPPTSGEADEGVSISVIAAVATFMFYSSISRRGSTKKIVLPSMWGVAVALLAFTSLFAAGPVGEVLAQMTTTVTSTRTVTSTVCTATDMVTYTSTVTQYMPITTTITTTGTITVTSTLTTTQTAYVTQTYTTTSTSFARVWVTSTVTTTSTLTSTTTITSTLVTTSTVTSTSTYLTTITRTSTECYARCFGHCSCWPWCYRCCGECGPF